MHLEENREIVEEKDESKRNEDIEEISSSVMDAVSMGNVVEEWVAVRFENYWYPVQVTNVMDDADSLLTVLRDYHITVLDVELNGLISTRNKLNFF